MSFDNLPVQCETRVAVLTIQRADINEVARDTPDGALQHAFRGQHVFDFIEQLGKPVIATVNGLALGGMKEGTKAFREKRKAGFKGR